MAQQTETQTSTGPIARRRWSSYSRRNTINGLLFAAPWIVGLLVFWIYPILASFYYSFTEFNGVQNPQWVGLQNYTTLFKDNLFRISAFNTLYFAVVSIPLAIFFAFGLALLLNRKIQGRIIYRTIYF